MRNQRLSMSVTELYPVLRKEKKNVLLTLLEAVRQANAMVGLTGEGTMMTHVDELLVALGL